MKYQRSVLLINPKFQLTFLFYGVSLAILGVVFNSSFQTLRQSSADGALFGGSSYAPFWVALSATVIFCCVSAIGLIISNHMCGPMHRLRNHMDAIAKGGEIHPIHFRDHDFFSEVEDSYNKLLQHIVKERESVKHPFPQR